MYRDSYMAASDWLSATIDKLNLCSDIRGDRSAIEAQLHKVQVCDWIVPFSSWYSEDKFLLSI